MAKCCDCRNCDVEHGEKFLDMWWKCNEGVADLKDVEDLDTYEIECDKCEPPPLKCITF